MSSRHEAEQALLAETPVAGTVLVTAAPYAFVVANNAGGNKLDYYLGREVTYTAGPCGHPRRSSEVVVRLSSWLLQVVGGCPTTSPGGWTVVRDGGRTMCLSLSTQPAAHSSRGPWRTGGPSWWLPRRSWPPRLHRGRRGRAPRDHDGDVPPRRAHLGGVSGSPPPAAREARHGAQCSPGVWRRAVSTATSMGAVRVLVVCTANICRSPSAEQLLRAALVRGGVPPTEVVVASAAWRRGTGGLAAPGLADCWRATWTTARWSAGAGGSRRLSADLVRGADLVLAADRGHRAAVARLVPAAHARLFTLRQAARLAAVLIGGDLPTAVALPPAGDVRGRLRWLVDELDAARGSGPYHQDDDVPDPHVIGDAAHEPVMSLLATAVTDLDGAVRVVLDHR